MKLELHKQLQANYDLLQTKILYLEKAKIINSNPALDFQLEQEIKELNVQSKEIKQRLENFSYED